MVKMKTKADRRDSKATERRNSAKAVRKLKSTESAAAAKKKKAAPGGADGAKPKTAQKHHVQPSQSHHEVPFGPFDNILLVGEGDFSFARSLAIEHGCANVTATSFDSEDEVAAKYPTYATNHADLVELLPPVPLHHSIDATKLHTYKALKPTQAHSHHDADDISEPQQPWDVIAFQFPHTGGLSTDVNRQVRANQALLVSFFKSCLEISSKPAAYVPSSAGVKAYNANMQPLGKKVKKVHDNHKPFLKMGGRVVVTLFEGEPYSLWNVRDLARHAGLKVVESWKFDNAQYPGYKHVRTLGAIEGGGAWKGEDRLARMYVFEKVPIVAKKDDADAEKKPKPSVMKRKRFEDDEIGSDSEAEDGTRETATEQTEKATWKTDLKDPQKGSRGNTLKTLFEFKG